MLEQWRGRRIHNVIYNPPCKLQVYVKLRNGRCPFSGLTNCDLCIANDHDQNCVDILRDTKPEGYGWV